MIKQSIAQDKIEQIKLESHVDNVKTGVNTNLVAQMSYHSYDLDKAIGETVKWAKKKQVGQHAKKFFDLLIDGTIVFLTNVIVDKGDK